MEGVAVLLSPGGEKNGKDCGGGDVEEREKGESGNDGNGQYGMVTVV